MKDILTVDLCTLINKWTVRNLMEGRQTGNHKWHMGIRVRTINNLITDADVRKDKPFIENGRTVRQTVN